MGINSKKLTILNILKKNRDKFISGVEISRRLNVSRTTVSNYIKDLKSDGYIIEAITNKGYSLRKTPDKLIPEEIISGLKTKKIGHSIEYYQQVDSTNNVAKKLAASGVEEGTLVLAEKQNEGRGRRGRNWHSPSGKGLWFSIILKPDFSPEKAPLLTVIASLTLGEVFESYQISPRIKWPNDIYLQGKKVAGVLSEISADMDSVFYAVIGMGINVNQQSFPGQLQEKAVSLKQIRDKKTNRVALLEDILGQFEKNYIQLCSSNSKKIINRWKKALGIMGEVLTVEKNGETYQGQVIDISPRGALVIEDNQGQSHSFWAGEASLDGE